MFSLITSFFSSLKINKYVLYAIAILLAIALTFFGYKSVINTYKDEYTKGFNAGVSQEDSKLQAQYTKALQDKLAENTKRLQDQFQLQLDSQKAQEQTKTVYIDRVKTVTQVIHDSTTLNKQDCQMNDNEFNEFNDATRSPTK